MNYNAEIEPQNAIGVAIKGVSQAIGELVQNIEMPPTPDNNNPAIAGDDAATNTHSYGGLPSIGDGRPEGATMLSQTIHDGLPAPDAWAKQMFASPPLQRTYTPKYDFAVVPTSPIWHKNPSQPPPGPSEWHDNGVFSPVHNPSPQHPGWPYFYDHHGSQLESPSASAAFLAGPETDDSDQEELAHPRPTRIVFPEQLEETADLLPLLDGSSIQIQYLKAENTRLQIFAAESAEKLRERSQQLVVALNGQKHLLLDSYQNEEMREFLQAELKQQTLENTRLQQNTGSHHGEVAELQKLHEAATGNYSQLQLDHQQHMVESFQVEQERNQLQTELTQQTLKNAAYQQDMEQAYRRKMQEANVYSHAFEVHHGHVGGEFGQLQIEKDSLGAQRDVYIQQIEGRDAEIRRIREEEESAITAMINRQVERHASNRDLVVDLRTEIEQERWASHEKDNEIRALRARVQEAEDTLEKEHQKVKRKTSQNKVLRMRYEVRGQQVRAYRQGVEQERKRQKEADETREQRRDAKRQHVARLARYAVDEIKNELASH